MLKSQYSNGFYWAVEMNNAFGEDTGPYSSEFLKSYNKFFNPYADVKYRLIIFANNGTGMPMYFWPTSTCRGLININIT